MSKLYSSISSSLSTSAFAITSCKGWFAKEYVRFRTRPSTLGMRQIVSMGGYWKIEQKIGIVSHRCWHLISETWIPNTRSTAKSSDDGFYSNPGEPGENDVMFYEGAELEQVSPERRKLPTLIPLWARLSHSRERANFLQDVPPLLWLLPCR